MADNNNDGLLLSMFNAIIKSPLAWIAGFFALRNTQEFSNSIDLLGINIGRWYDESMDWLKNIFLPDVKSGIAHIKKWLKWKVIIPGIAAIFFAWLLYPSNASKLITVVLSAYLLVLFVFARFIATPIATKFGVDKNETIETFKSLLGIPVAIALVAFLMTWLDPSHGTILNFTLLITLLMVLVAVDARKNSSLTSKLMIIVVILVLGHKAQVKMIGKTVADNHTDSSLDRIAAYFEGWTGDNKKAAALVRSKNNLKKSQTDIVKDFLLVIVKEKGATIYKADLAKDNNPLSAGEQVYVCNKDQVGWPLKPTSLLPDATNYYLLIVRQPAGTPVGYVVSDRVEAVDEVKTKEEDRRSTAKVVIKYREADILNVKPKYFFTLYGIKGGSLYISVKGKKDLAEPCEVFQAKKYQPPAFHRPDNPNLGYHILTSKSRRGVRRSVCERKIASL